MFLWHLAPEIDDGADGHREAVVRGCENLERGGSVQGHCGVVDPHDTQACRGVV